VEDDDAIALLRDAVLVYGGLNFCAACNAEANPDAPVFTDDEYDAQAHAMHAGGWASPDGLAVLCPACRAVPSPD